MWKLKFKAPNPTYRWKAYKQCYNAADLLSFSTNDETWGRGGRGNRHSIRNSGVMQLLRTNDNPGQNNNNKRGNQIAHSVEHTFCHVQGAHFKPIAIHGRATQSTNRTEVGITVLRPYRYHLNWSRWVIIWMEQIKIMCKLLERQEHSISFMLFLPKNLNQTKYQLQLSKREMAIVFWYSANLKTRN